MSVVGKVFIKQKRWLCIDMLTNTSLFVLQTHKSQPKSQSTTLHGHDKMRDGLSDPTPPYKMLRRSDESPVNKYSDGHSKTKTFHTLRGKDGGKPKENRATHKCRCSLLCMFVNSTVCTEKLVRLFSPMRA